MPKVLIISATSDIAQACAKVYAQNGYSLLLAARDLARCKKVATDLMSQSNTKVNCLYFDAEKPETHQTFFEEVKKQCHSLGGLNGIVVCTDYLGDQKLAEQSPDEATKIIQCNYSAPARIIEMLTPLLEQSRLEQYSDSFIVGISSVAGERGRQSNYMYGASKAAFSTYLSGLRNRLQAQNINVLTVKPGYVDTKVTANIQLPSVLILSPEDLATKIFTAQQKGKSEINSQTRWRLIMTIIRLIPEPIFRRLKL